MKLSILALGCVWVAALYVLFGFPFLERPAASLTAFILVVLAAATAFVLWVELYAVKPQVKKR